MTHFDPILAPDAELFFNDLLVARIENVFIHQGTYFATFPLCISDTDPGLVLAHEQLRRVLNMGDETEIIGQVRKRAANPETRTDWGGRALPELSPPASEEALAKAEQALGCVLHRMHRRLLLEVGNGGFGPGNGLIGLTGGCTDEEGRSVVELRDALFGNVIPVRVVPLWNWGDGAWACLDEEKGTVLIVDESGVTDTGFQLSTCMAEWAAGAELTERFFTFEVRSGINPFTKVPTTARSRSRAVGKPLGD